MKKHIDPRHKRRQVVVKQLFAHSFTKQKATDAAVRTILKKQPTIDKLIESAAPLWPINQINRIDLSILRLAVYELLSKKEPVKVIIDEAVELAKEFGSEASPAFVNGVLGKIVEEKEMEK
ncbi:transcription antitermination factor NusB [Candidatus Microgenomates bacterium]|nr:transcription antitermination factor NusB [Candidatus Microgenomates bacterium]